ncbi:hypothetical protein BG004_007590 [Podila humilis]|nr:hypothetical protein BG004_007590 [Podila humilis]
MNLNRKRQFDQLLHTRDSHDASKFPSLFCLAAKTCINHIQIFATLDGLPFEPFGQTLLTTFAEASNQWSVTNEQRQVGILLLSEAYGADYLGPEYTGLQCGLPSDIPFLSHFTSCLVYLNLSDARCTTNSYPLDGSGGGIDEGSLSDSDLAGLSCLPHLRILDLSGLDIGDTGLGHITRSISFGSGPLGLEYLNLAGTNVTEKGLVKLFRANNKTALSGPLAKRAFHPVELVFKQLLGLDLSGTKVDNADTVIADMFPPMLAPVEAKMLEPSVYEVGWKRLGKNTRLFPTQTTVGRTKTVDYLEPETNTNPIKPWIDRFAQQPHRLTFGQKPDLEVKDGLGLAECLALAKLGQLFMAKAPDSPPLYPTKERSSRTSESSNQLGGSVGKNGRRRGRYSRRLREQNEGEITSLKQDKLPTVEQENMFNLTMYQRVLDVACVYSQAVKDSEASIKSKLRKSQPLVFVRSRTDAAKHLKHGSGILVMEPTAKATPGATSAAARNEDESRLTANLNRNPVGNFSTIAKLRVLPASDRVSKNRLDHDIFKTLAISPWQSLADDIRGSDNRVEEERLEPDRKRIKESSMHCDDAVIKMERTVMAALTTSAGADNHLPTRRKRQVSSGLGGFTIAPPQLFLKPKEEIPALNLFVGSTTTPSTPRQESILSADRPETIGTYTTQVSPKKKPVSANLMKTWIQPSSSRSSSSPSSFSSSSAMPLSATPKQQHIAPSTNIRREFHMHKKTNNVVSLHRWIRNGSKNSSGSTDHEERKVVRVDPRKERLQEADNNEPLLHFDQ